MMMKRFLRRLPGLSLAALMLMAIGCSSETTAETEKTENVVASETASQMEEAAILGRNAAKEIVTKNWSDTMALQTAILRARAASSKYDVTKQKDCREAFDTAFFNTIRTVRPELAAQLEAGKNK